ncbi:MAG: RNA-binding S4 domain-containing protein [Corynebacterium sp.]|nr:RNA-binding S4 domain-containing protein [Corynebacterium sp.]
MHVDITIRDESIKLGQFVKLANLVETGGEAKKAILEGQVFVNDEVDTRRGRTLREGDTVRVGANSATVRTGEDDFFDEATANDDFDPEKWRNVQIDPITFE